MGIILFFGMCFLIILVSTVYLAVVFRHHYKEWMNRKEEEVK